VLLKPLGRGCFSLDINKCLHYVCNMSINLKFILDSRKKNSQEIYRVKLRIIHNRSSAYLATEYKLHAKDWDPQKERIKTNSKSIADVARENNRLAKMKALYLTQLFELGDLENTDYLTAAQIKSKLENKPTEVKTFYTFLKEQTDLYNSSGKNGTARTYEDLYNKLQKTEDVKSLSFADINYAFLQRLEHQHLSEGFKYGSLSVYLRTLRSLYNKAIKMGIAEERHYPFKKYTIKKGSPERKALSKDQFERLKSAELQPGSALQIGRDYFLCSYYLHGINWIDLCQLKYKNLVDDGKRISFQRQKTGKPFNIKLSEAVITLIDQFKPISSKEPEDYLFPILTLDTPSHLKMKRIQNRRLKINTYLRTLADKLEIPRFSYYAARHTFATLLWNKSRSASIAQQSLGHSTEKQTQEYLKSFGNTDVDEAADQLFSDM
jgi:integrase/recombinase XerD